jgi:D-erythro-7,8-dihydroneopterin triphosphate epimerase
MNRRLDKITIKDLSLRCIIGINDDERVNKQDVIINIVMYSDLKDACKSDNIDDTVDYKLIKKKIIAMVEDSSFFLIEKLAETVAEICLENKQVVKVDVEIDKPGALRFARSVSVDIERYNR